jgi:hypothetical protein
MYTLRQAPGFMPGFGPSLTTIRKEYIRGAVRSGNKKWLKQLVDSNPELEPFALRELMRKQPQGRQKGEPRVGDYPPHIEEAYGCIQRVRDIWERKLGRRYRAKDTSPSAFDIAAEYTGVSEDQLRNYAKNRHRRK